MSVVSHRRLHGRSGQYSTVTEHMQPDHQKYLEWNGDRFRRWADSIGGNTRKVVDAILTSGRVEQQTYRSCMGLLKLAEKHSPIRLEEACKKAFLYSRTPSYKSIKDLLAATKEDPSLLHKIRIHFHQRPDHRRLALQEMPDTTDIKDHDQSKYH